MHRRLAIVSLFSALLFTPVLAGVALAEEVTGACCLASGGCNNLIGDTCESQAGTYIGDGTSCSDIECSTPLAAPMLSIFGLVSAVGMLGGFGLYRLLFRSR